MSVDEFLVWADARPGRYELHHGFVVAMAPGLLIHARLKGLVYRRFCEQIERSGLPCEAFPDGPGVRITAETSYQPDATVRCAKTKLGDEVRFIPDPLVIVEVASPSTQGLDGGTKLEDYFQLPSLRHYVIIRPTTKVILHHERREDGSILIHIIRDGRLVLDPPGIRIEDVFTL